MLQDKELILRDQEMLQDKELILRDQECLILLKKELILRDQEMLQLMLQKKELILQEEYLEDKGRISRQPYTWLIFDEILINTLT